jgi:phosphoglycolate phosphatase
MKLIILDFDGTLADTRGLIVMTMQQTIQELGLESRTDDQCAAMIGLPLKQAYRSDSDDRCHVRLLCRYLSPDIQ